jgi:hypothetical protein
MDRELLMLKAPELAIGTGESAVFSRGTADAGM